MIPVPSTAGFNKTRADPNIPITSWGMVVPMSGIGIIFFLAWEMPLRMASATSLALPSDTPTRPRVLPTTTNALKESFLPPFVTFETRLILTTFSTASLDSLTAIGRTIAKTPIRLFGPPQQAP